MLSRCDEIELLQLELDLVAEEIETDHVLIKLRKKKSRKKQKKRSCWTRPWLLRRREFGHYDNLIQELSLEDVKSYKNYLRMPKELFDEVLSRITHRIEKDTFWRKALEPGMRLAITLRYLATGDSYRSLAYSFRTAHNTISKIIPETCEAIISEYLGEVMPCPKTPEEWKNIAKEFSSRWNFHHTIGALDGKHVAIRCPPSGGSLYYNYKGFHSIVLLGLVDADYKFLYVDVGAYGHSSDGGVFSDTQLYKALEANTVGLPDPEPLPNDNKPVPYHMVADDAFALRTWMMKPFQRRHMSREERVFNYRLSRARRVVENSFGIMSSR